MDAPKRIGAQNAVRERLLKSSRCDEFERWDGGGDIVRHGGLDELLEIKEEEKLVVAVVEFGQNHRAAEGDSPNRCAG